jgi:anti-sigma B factor antagonist
VATATYVRARSDWARGYREEGTHAFHSEGHGPFGGSTQVEVAVRSIAVCKVTVEPLEDACVIRVAGELDASTAERLRAPLDAARADGLTTLVDLAGVTFIDSSGLRVLLEAARASDEHEWAWFIVRPSAAVLRLLELSGTAGLLPLVAPGHRASRRKPARVVPLHAARRDGARRVAEG